jgi:hypothetical protein
MHPERADLIAPWERIQKHLEWGSSSFRLNYLHLFHFDVADQKMCEKPVLSTAMIHPAPHYTHFNVPYLRVFDAPRL